MQDPPYIILTLYEFGALREPIETGGAEVLVSHNLFDTNLFRVIMEKLEKVCVYCSHYGIKIASP